MGTQTHSHSQTHFKVLPLTLPQPSCFVQRADTQENFQFCSSYQQRGEASAGTSPHARRSHPPRPWGWDGGLCSGAPARRVEERREQQKNPTSPGQSLSSCRFPHFHKNGFRSSSLTRVPSFLFLTFREGLSPFLLAPTGRSRFCRPLPPAGSAPPSRKARQLVLLPRCAGSGGSALAFPRTPLPRGHTLGTQPFSSFGFPFSSKYFRFPLAGPCSLPPPVRTERWVRSQEGDWLREASRGPFAHGRGRRARGERSSGLGLWSLRVPGGARLHCPGGGLPHGPRPPCAPSASRSAPSSTSLAGVRAERARAPTALGTGLRAPGRRPRSGAPRQALPRSVVPARRPDPGPHGTTRLPQLLPP